MFLQFLCDSQNNTFNLDKAYTAKSLQIHSVYKQSKHNGLNNMVLFCRIDFIGNQNYKSFVNITGGMMGDSPQVMEKVINLGEIQNGKVIWSDKYLPLIDPKKHEAIHIPQQVNIQFFYLNGDNEFTKVDDSHLQLCGITLELDAVNK